MTTAPLVCEIGDGEGWRLVGPDGRAVVMPDGFLGGAALAWLRPETVPAGPVAMIAPPAEAAGGDALPVWFGDDAAGDGWTPGDEARWSVDLIGTAFFLMSRYEEVARPVADEHGRFPATASLMAGAGVLDRPVVDQLCAWFGRLLRRQWPDLPLAQRAARVLPSHDVDEPFRWAMQPAARTLRRTAGHLLRRRDPAAAWGEASGWAAVRAGLRADPFDTFDRLMDEADAAAARAIFYFTSEGAHPVYDKPYSLASPRIQALLNRIASRGHDVGLHPGYQTMEDGDEWRRQLDRLAVAMPAGHSIAGVRHHYLRMRVPEAWRRAAAAGVGHEASLGFADAPGFRAGTAWAYGAWDVERSEALDVQVQPLILMEVSLLAEGYQSLSYEEAAAAIERLRSRSLAVGGDWSFLWHNSRLETARDWELFRRALRG
jgi:hypothetical protein